MKLRMPLAILLAIAAAPAVAQSPLDGLSAGNLADGERLFRIHCARCHGIDGAGGEGSNLAKARLKYAPDDEALIDVIDGGIPGTGMPAIWSLDDEQSIRVAGYVRTLGQLEDEEMPGDPVRGRQVYQTNGGCPACHIISGAGKGVGPELTYVGDQRGLAYLRQSLTDPAAAQSQTSGYQDYLTVRLRTDDQSVEGLRVDEDAFSIVVRDVSGTVHSFRKDELTEYDKVFAHSLMPEYGAALS
ncbi:MAG: c-type cytochrome, partial [Gammaproteobacteria bacterium]|nr:c-type cytochrome [Gammaproteobacteria bacterium]